ncbi:MAG: hypothetical protein TREMPRED_000766 [Tremellales sp. Tagirdzhanova-0007]|nr:MAG: hypothetical protein TREMPRED_000766 [Tremellales sp. Tagirdzhanova-0007]
MAEIIAVVAVVAIILGGNYFRIQDTRNDGTVGSSDAVSKEEEVSDTLDEDSAHSLPERHSTRRPRRTTHTRTRHPDTSDEPHSASSASDEQSLSPHTSSRRSDSSLSGSSSPSHSKKKRFFTKHAPRHTELKEPEKKNFDPTNHDPTNHDRTRKSVNFTRGDVTSVGQADTAHRIIDSTDEEAGTYPDKRNKDDTKFSTRKEDKKLNELTGRDDGTESPMHQVVPGTRRKLWEVIQTLDKDYNKKNCKKTDANRKRLALYDIMDLLEWFGAFDFLRSDITQDQRDYFERNEWSDVYGALPTIAYRAVTLILDRSPMPNLYAALQKPPESNDDTDPRRNKAYPLRQIIKESQQLDFDLILGFFVIPFRGFMQLGHEEKDPAQYWHVTPIIAEAVGPVSAAILRWLVYIGRTMLRARMFSLTGADLLDGSIRLQVDYAPLVGGYRMNATIFTQEAADDSPLAKPPEPIWYGYRTHRVIIMCREKAITWIAARSPGAKIGDPKFEGLGSCRLYIRPGWSRQSLKASGPAGITPSSRPTRGNMDIEAKVMSVSYANAKKRFERHFSDRFRALCIGLQANTIILCDARQHSWHGPSEGKGMTFDASTIEFLLMLCGYGLNEVLGNNPLYEFRTLDFGRFIPIDKIGIDPIFFPLTGFRSLQTIILPYKPSIPPSGAGTIDPRANLLTARLLIDPLLGLADRLLEPTDDIQQLRVVIKMRKSYRAQLILDMKGAFELYVSYLRATKGSQPGFAAGVYSEVSARIQLMRPQILLEDTAANGDSSGSGEKLRFGDEVDVRQWCQEMIQQSAVV